VQYQKDIHQLYTEKCIIYFVLEGSAKIFYHNVYSHGDNFEKVLLDVAGALKKDPYEINLGYKEKNKEI
jgi:hypothetical protein